MSVELQKAKRNDNLANWAEMIRSCKNSRKTVKVWCLEHGVNEKTYYYRQKQICNALPLKKEPPVLFAEVNRPGTCGDVGNGICIQIGIAKISVDSAPDLNLLRDILRVVAEIC